MWLWNAVRSKVFRRRPEQGYAARDGVVVGRIGDVEIGSGDMCRRQRGVPAALDAGPVVQQIPSVMPLGTLAANLMGGYIVGVAVAFFALNNYSGAGVAAC